MPHAALHLTSHTASLKPRCWSRPPGRNANVDRPTVRCLAALPSDSRLNEPQAELRVAVVDVRHRRRGIVLVREALPVEHVTDREIPRKDVGVKRLSELARQVVVDIP